MQPVDYSIKTEKLSNPFTEGLVGGVAFKDFMQQNEQKKQLKQQLQTDIGDLFNNPNASAKDYSSFILKYPQYSEQANKAWGILSPEIQNNKLDQASQVYAALVNGDVEVAKNLLTKQSEAYRNSNMEREAEAADTWVKLIGTDKKAAENSAALFLSSVLGPEKFEGNYGGLLEERRQKALHPLNIQKQTAEANIKSLEASNAGNKISLENREAESKLFERAEKLGIEKDKLMLDYKERMNNLDPSSKLGPDALKIINESTVQAAIDEQSANQKLELADRIENNLSNQGVLTRGWEAVKSLSGSEDTESLIRKEYTRLRNSEAIRALPPGVATDKDIALALQGIPSANANSDALSSFLRGMAKLQKRESEFNTIKSEWVNEVGYLGKSKRDVEVNGVQVPAGTNFGNFASQYMKMSKTKEAQEEVPSRSYMVFAQ